MVLHRFHLISFGPRCPPQRLFLGSLISIAACEAPNHTDETPPSSNDTKSEDETSDDDETDNQQTTTDDAEPTSWKRICDGSSELRLAISAVGGEEVFSQLQTWNGWRYLYITGDCRYWSFDREYPNWAADTHTGILSPELERELSLAFDYHRWEEFQGFHPAGGGFDTLTTIFYDGQHRIDCEHICDSGAPEVQRWREQAHLWYQRLSELGQPMDGPLRIDLRISGPWDPEGWELPESCLEHLRWPLAWDPIEKASTGNLPPEKRKLWRIEDPNDIALLREARDKFRFSLIPDECNTAKRGGTFVFSYGNNPPKMYDMRMRDALPLEEEDGPVPLGEPPY